MHHAQATTKNMISSINKNSENPQLNHKVIETPNTTNLVAPRVATRAPKPSFQNDVDRSQPRTLRVRPNEGAHHTQLPRLVQGTNQLKTYFANAAAAFYSTSKDKTKEVEFITAFLKGFREAKQREIVVKELQKVHPCWTGKRGTVEIICEWKDVGEAMRKIGLIEPGGEERPAKRRKKILIPMEMIESGMMN